MVRIWSLEKRCSSATASTTSCSLRATDLSGVSSWILTSCCVIVLPPSFRPRLVTSTHTARAIEVGSTQHGLGRVLAHVAQREVDVVVAGGAPVLDDLAVAVEDHHIARGKHVDVGVREILHRPDHVARAREEEQADRNSDRHPMSREPAQDAVSPADSQRTGAGVPRHPSSPSSAPDCLKRRIRAVTDSASEVKRGAAASYL